MDFKLSVNGKICMRWLLFEDLIFKSLVSQVKRIHMCTYVKVDIPPNDRPNDVYFRTQSAKFSKWATCWPKTRVCWPLETRWTRFRYFEIFRLLCGVVRMTMALLVKYLFMFSRLDYKENTARNQQVCCLFGGWPSLMAIQKQYPLVVLKH